MSDDEYDASIPPERHAENRHLAQPKIVPPEIVAEGQDPGSLPFTIDSTGQKTVQMRELTIEGDPQEVVGVQSAYDPTTGVAW